MTFINNHMHPFDFTQDRPILDDEFVRCEENLKITPAHGLLLLLSGIWWALVYDSFDRGSPFLEFQIPVGQCAIRY